MVARCTPKMAERDVCGPATECFSPLPTLSGNVNIFNDTEEISYTMHDGLSCIRCGLGNLDILRVSRTLPVRHGDIVQVEFPGIPVHETVRYTERAAGLIALWKHNCDPWILRRGSCRLFRVLGRTPVSADVMAWIKRLPLWRAPAYLAMGTDPFGQALEKAKREAMGITNQPTPEAIDRGMDALWSYVRSRQRLGRILNLRPRLPYRSSSAPSGASAS